MKNIKVSLYCILRSYWSLQTIYISTYINITITNLVHVIINHPRIKWWICTPFILKKKSLNVIGTRLTGWLTAQFFKQMMLNILHLEVQTQTEMTWVLKSNQVTFSFEPIFIWSNISFASVTLKMKMTCVLH